MATFLQAIAAAVSIGRLSPFAIGGDEKLLIVSKPLKLRAGRSNDLTVGERGFRIEKVRRKNTHTHTSPFVVSSTTLKGHLTPWAAAPRTVVALFAGTAW